MVVRAWLLAMVAASGSARAFADPAPTRTIDVPGARIDVVIEAGAVERPDAVLAWVETAGRAVAAYYGRFPLARAHVVIDVVDGDGVGSGTARDSDGGSVFVDVGRHVGHARLGDDWVMTHELVHLAFPSLARRHHWMEEGLATYVEPIARARLGTLPAEKVWADLVAGLPNGLPGPGDRGLDRTPTWGRTYWGGALYFLLADVEIRRRTGNHKGLEHALRAIVAAGGTIGADWSIARVLAAGDAATGVPVLRELYERMKASPAPVDLRDLWQRLGVVADGHGSVRFDARAPLAAVRAAITSNSGR